MPPLHHNKTKRNQTHISRDGKKEKVAWRRDPARVEGAFPRVTTWTESQGQLAKDKEGGCGRGLAEWSHCGVGGQGGQGTALGGQASSGWAEPAQDSGLFLRTGCHMGKQYDQI